ncbi:MAG: hypothetical protein PHV30_11490, partial [Candidatus Margulisbacteria bacterium]|nr:hypothetical protein [Candidatus Margulisiibacteriota bacterium]
SLNGAADNFVIDFSKENFAAALGKDWLKWLKISSDGTTQLDGNTLRIFDKRGSSNQEVIDIVMNNNSATCQFIKDTGFDHALNLQLDTNSAVIGLKSKLKVLWAEGHLLSGSADSTTDYSDSTVIIDLPDRTSTTVQKFNYYSPNTTLGKRSLFDEFARDFIGISATDWNGYPSMFDTTAQNLITTYGLPADVDFTGNGPSTYHLLRSICLQNNTDSLSSQARETYNNTAKKYNQYAARIKDLLNIINDGTNLKTNIKNSYLDEFYMRNNYSPLLIGSELQSRFGNGLYNFDDMEYLDRNNISQKAWYETRGRYIPASGIESKQGRTMNFAFMKYGLVTDPASQLSRAGIAALSGTNKIANSTVSIDKESKKDSRSNRKLKAEDYYDRIKLYSDDSANSFLDGGFASSAYEDHKSILYNDDFQKVKWIDSMSAGTDKNNAIEDLFTLLERSYSGTDYNGQSTDYNSIVSSYTNNMAAVGNYYDTLTDFTEYVKCVYQMGGTSDFLSDFMKDPTYALDSTFLTDVYQILSGHKWYSNRIGPNSQQIHTQLEMSSMSQEITYAGLMTSIYNQNNKDMYNEQSDHYKEDKQKADDDEYQEQMMEAAAQKRKAWLAALARKKRG